MSSNKKYRPNYEALYPGIIIPNAVMDVLRKTDRKIEYMECDLKQERIVRNKAGEIIHTLPSREDSYDRLLEVDKQFAGASPSPEQIFFQKQDIRQLHHCIDLLAPSDKALIMALFYEGMTEREYGQLAGMSKSAVHRRKIKILSELKKYLISFGN